jgi:hypothetical protein
MSAIGRKQSFIPQKFTPGKWLLCAQERNFATSNHVWLLSAISGPMRCTAKVNQIRGLVAEYGLVAQQTDV